MISLETSYLGLKLKNPVIVSSSGLTNSVEKIKKLAEAGAGAIVLKSLFEEQINHEAGKVIDANDYPEAADYVMAYTRSNSILEYLNLISEARKAVDIPVIASINCVSSDEWITFAREIEKAGAHAIELNVYILPTKRVKSSSDYEALYIDLVSKIKHLVKIPVSVKLGQHFTNLPQMIDQIEGAGVNGVVLFNRFYQPDIDIKEMKIVSADVFSSPDEIRNTLRWIGILSGQKSTINIAASTGVHDGETVVKLLLAGADAVQVCSVLYKKGPEHLKTIIAFVENWMKEKGFKSIKEFKGMLNYKNIPDHSMYERSQFMKYFSSIQ